MGIMQAAVAEKRHRVSKDQFVEGLSLVNLVPGATATELGIFLGHARCEWRGSIVAGLCFVVPAFCIMIVLPSVYAALGATPHMHRPLGLGHGRARHLCRSRLPCRASGGLEFNPTRSVRSRSCRCGISTLGAATVLALAIGVGILLFHSRRAGALVTASVGAVLIIIKFASWAPFIAVTPAGQPGAPAGLAEIGAFFLGVGAFTFGGGITMVALVQEQLVSHLRWLTQQEFIDGLALGQFTPGPIPMVAAYVGYKVGGIADAPVAATAVFLPSFVLMWVSLPLVERVRAPALGERRQ